MGAIDARVIADIGPQHRPMVVPTAAQLSDAQYFILRGLRVWLDFLTD